MAVYTLYLFNSLGDWIATQVDTDVYSIDNQWVGWVRDEDKVVFDGENQYIGTIVRGNRLYYFEDHPVLTISNTLVSSPPCATCPGFPGREDKDKLPDGARDVEQIS